MLLQFSTYFLGFHVRRSRTLLLADHGLGSAWKHPVAMYSRHLTRQILQLTRNAGGVHHGGVVRSRSTVSESLQTVDQVGSGSGKSENQVPATATAKKPRTNLPFAKNLFLGKFDKVRNWITLYTLAHHQRWPTILSSFLKMETVDWPSPAKRFVQHVDRIETDTWRGLF